MQGIKLFVVFFILLVIIYIVPIAGIFLLVAASSSADQSTAYGLVTMVQCVQLGLILLVTVYGTRGRTSNPGFWSYLGTFILSLIPIAFLLPIYWWARYIIAGRPKEMPARLISEAQPFPAGETKKCPFCAETIKAEAIVCRFCGRDLPEKPSSIPASSEADFGQIRAQSNPETAGNNASPWVTVVFIAVALLLGCFVISAIGWTYGDQIVKLLFPG